jgi:Putative transposase of IS4/5 family (DUF4096)
VPEVRRLLLALAQEPAHHPACLSWSRFRRAHQATAQRGHRIRRARRMPPQPETGSPPPPTGEGEAQEAGIILALAGTAALTEGSWEQILPLLPPLRGEPGRPRRDHRRLLEGILWVMRSGHAWRDLPACYGPWQTAYHRLRQWNHEGLWDGICQILHPGAEIPLFSP